MADALATSPATVRLARQACHAPQHSPGPSSSSGPHVPEAESGAAVVKVIERKDPTPDELAKDQDTLRNELLSERKQKFFASYMAMAKKRMTIRTHPETIAQIVG